MYQRRLDLPKLLTQKSFFLFGPRATGKTTLVREQLPDAKVFDLLDADVFADMVRQPKLLGEVGEAPIVVVDEIQRLPSLLNEVHRLIESTGRRFLLTGSSARKLRRGGANLLAGRAWKAELFPLVRHEIDDFDLTRYLNRGGLPQVYTSDFPNEELRSYVGLYLQEEIQAEGLTRNLPAFSRFLDVIALNNGEELHYQNLSSDCGVTGATISNYVDILEDTLIGFRLPGYNRTKKRKAIQRARHYLFDVGVTNRLARRGNILPDSELYGRAFEHFILQEARAYLSYARSDTPMSYWRSTTQFEVDLLLGDKTAIEIKASALVQDKHLKGLRALKEEGIFENYVVVSRDRTIRHLEDGIVVYPWEQFLGALWAGEFG